MLRKEAYEILGVQETDDQDVVKKAFRKKAAQLHPDKNQDPNAENEFKKVNEAYRILIGEQNSDDYVAPHINDPFSRMNIDFASIFGGNFHRSGPNVRPIEVKRFSKKLTFEESALGGECKIEYNVRVHCKECEGGNKNRKACPACNGEGAVHRVQRQANFSTIYTEGCKACHGVGSTNGEDCKKCHGKTYDTLSKTINLKIPPVGDKTASLRLAKAGNIYFIHGKEIHGDVIIDLIPSILSSDGKMKIVGNDIVSKEEVKLDTLMFGGDITVQTISGKQELKIPEKSRAGSIFRIKGYGVSTKPNAGNHLVELEIKYPKKLTEEFKKAIQKAYED